MVLKLDLIEPLGFDKGPLKYGWKCGSTVELNTYCWFFFSFL